MSQSIQHPVERKACITKEEQNGRGVLRLSKHSTKTHTQKNNFLKIILYTFFHAFHSFLKELFLKRGKMF
jgi:hypothetical protein